MNPDLLFYQSYTVCKYVFFSFCYYRYSSSGMPITWAMTTLAKQSTRRPFNVNIKSVTGSNHVTYILLHTQRFDIHYDNGPITLGHSDIKKKWVITSCFMSPTIYKIKKILSVWVNQQISSFLKPTNTPLKRFLRLEPLCFLTFNYFQRQIK